MQKLTLVLSLLSAGLSGLALALAARLDLARKPDADGGAAALASRVEALERALGEKAPIPPAPLPRGEPGANPGAPAGKGPDARSGPTLATTPATSATLPDLARRLAEVERAVKAGRASAAVPAEGAAGGQTASAPTTFAMPPVYGSVDDAAKHLDLTPSQRSDFDRIVADAKRDMDALKKIPDDEGKTWEQAQGDTFKMTDGGFSIDTTKVQTFREKVIPGRGESFGTAERRIRDDAKRRLRDTLSTEQQAKYDKARVDPLVGGNGDGFGMFITSLSTDVVTPDVAPPDGK